MDGILVNLPFYASDISCSEISFSDGLSLINEGEYVNPNQVYPMLINGDSNLTACLPTSNICVGNDCDDLSLEVVSVTDNFCYIYDAGEIQIVATGGATPLIYEWIYQNETLQGPTTSQDDIGSLEAGDYTIIVSDHKWMFVSHTKTFEEPA